ncbi:cysteine proteinase inhibitor 5-like protein, partial [Tanacetum coccineum]
SSGLVVKRCSEQQMTCARSAYQNETKKCVKEACYVNKEVDTKVVDIGKFAIARHNYQAKTHLAFNNLVSGQIRSRAGTEYNMTIAAKDGNDADMLKNYIAMVIDR